jgi:hypothetical protein
MHVPRYHDGYVTVNDDGESVMHDTLDDAIAAAGDDPDLAVYWCERTPLT